MQNDHIKFFCNRKIKRASYYTLNVGGVKKLTVKMLVFYSNLHIAAKPENQTYPNLQVFTTDLFSNISQGLVSIAAQLLYANQGQKHTFLLNFRRFGPFFWTPSQYSKKTKFMKLGLSQLLFKKLKTYLLHHSKFLNNLYAKMAKSPF